MCSKVLTESQDEVICKSMKLLPLPEGTTEIASHGFAENKELIKVEIPNGVKKIGDCAFFMFKFRRNKNSRHCK